MKVLQICNVKKYYNAGNNVVKAIDGVSFEVEKGEFLSIVGRSGSGKSTLLYLVGGLEVPTSGDIYYNNENLTEKNQEELTIFRRKNLGFIFQSSNLVPILNVYENIVIPLELDNKDIDKEFIDDILSTLELDNKRYVLPNQLSGGQQQRVAIARAIASKPQIILADEPTGNLDTQTSGEVMNLLKKMTEKFNQTLIMITHNTEIAKMADRIIRIEDGRIQNEMVGVTYGKGK